MEHHINKINEAIAALEEIPATPEVEKSALNAATEVSNDADATQAEVDTAYEEL